MRSCDNLFHTTVHTYRKFGGAKIYEMHIYVYKISAYVPLFWYLGL